MRINLLTDKGVLAAVPFQRPEAPALPEIEPIPSTKPSVAPPTKAIPWRLVAIGFSLAAVVFLLVGYATNWFDGGHFFGLNRPSQESGEIKYATIKQVLLEDSLRHVLRDRVLPDSLFNALLPPPSRDTGFMYAEILLETLATTSGPVETQTTAPKPQPVYGGPIWQQENRGLLLLAAHLAQTVDSLQIQGKVKLSKSRIDLQLTVPNSRSKTTLDSILQRFSGGRFAWRLEGETLRLNQPLNLILPPLASPGYHGGLWTLLDSLLLPYDRWLEALEVDTARGIANNPAQFYFRMSPKTAAEMFRTWANSPANYAIDSLYLVVTARDQSVTVALHFLQGEL